MPVPSPEVVDVQAGRFRIPLHAISHRLAVILAMTAVTCALAACAPLPARELDTAAPELVIETDDVYRFYRLYDKASARPTAEQLQQYIDTGSPGLRVFAEQRRTTGVRIADAMAANPGVYADARQCVDVLPRVRKRVVDALLRLGERYPDARFPPVTVAVGRSKPVAIGSPVTGVQIGLEALCATHYLNPDIEDRFVRVIVHEFVHVQQPTETTDAENPTLLEAALMEGSAEFVTELVSGDVAYTYLPALAKGRETGIESAFLADKAGRDLSAWIGNGTADKPGDLGYWVGYRIAKAYYRHAPDKRIALREILQWRDAEVFLAASGWRPGMRL
jgi:hypothetical protein